MAIALDGTPQIQSLESLTQNTFTIPLPATSNSGDVVTLLIFTNYYNVTGVTDNSGVTSAWSQIETTGAAFTALLWEYRTIASAPIGGGAVATVTLSGSNDNAGGCSFALSGANTVTPSYSGFPITGTTSPLSFTTATATFNFAFYYTAPNGDNGSQGTTWQAIGSSGVGTGTGGLQGNPGVSNSPIYGCIAEFYIGTTSGLTAGITPDGTGAIVYGLGDAIQPASGVVGIPVWPYRM
jgi:hypothetical protein